MDAIKKKMQAMKAEKDNAMDRADTCEQQSRDANLRAEKVQSKTFLPDQKEMTTFASLVLFMFRRQLTSINGKWIIQSEEEVRALQKKMQQLENDLDQAQENLLAANSKLEEKDKALQTVSSLY